jgi:hypothetical protein
VGLPRPIRTALCPAPAPRRVFFGNSGAEAVEAALKMARYHTGRDKFVGFLGAFHGRTMGALSLTGSKAVQKQGFAPLLGGVTHIPYAYCYRCAYGKQVETCAVECVKVLEDTLFKTILPAQEVAAIFVEPVQGEGGYVVPPRKFFDELQAVARRHGILLVWTKCRPEWAGRAKCMPMNTLAPIRTSSRWPRASRGASVVGDDRQGAVHAVEAGRARLDFRRQPGGRGGIAGDDRTAGAGTAGQRRPGWRRDEGADADLAGAVPDRRRRPRAGADARLRDRQGPGIARARPGTAQRDRPARLSSRDADSLGAGQNSVRLAPPLV